MKNIVFVPFFRKRIFPRVDEFLAESVFSKKYVDHNGIINIF